MRTYTYTFATALTNGYIWMCGEGDSSSGHSAGYDRNFSGASNVGHRWSSSQTLFTTTKITITKRMGQGAFFYGY